MTGATTETAMNQTAGGHDERLARMKAGFAAGEDDAPAEDLLLLVIGGEEILVRASEVAEVVRPVRLTPVPMGPAHLLGLANIHGQIVCIIEPSGVVGLPPTGEETPRTRFVVLRHPRMHVGIRVDAVPAMHRVLAESLPEAASVEEGDYRAGEVSVAGRSYPLLHVESLLH